MSIKTQRTLQEVFLSIFHHKLSFEDFLHTDIEKEYKLYFARKRHIYAPTNKLKYIHRFINTSILEYADYEDEVVFSYRKGKTIRDAVEKHSENEYFYQTDIRDFYRNIRYNNVLSSLKKQLSNVPIADIGDYVDLILKLTVVDDHIPIGFSTSPILSNICLKEFDCLLLKYCHEHNLVYTRYSDDIIISSKNDHFTKVITGVIQVFLCKTVNEHASLNKEKTRIQRKSRGVRILGFSILQNGVITIPNSEKKEIEILLHFYLNDRSRFEDYIINKIHPVKVESGEKSAYEHGLSYLSGKLIAINAMDKAYIAKLKRKYGNTLIEMFIRKTVI